MRTNPAKLVRGDRIVDERSAHRVKVYSANVVRGKGVGYTVVNLSPQFGGEVLPDGISFGLRYDNSVSINVL